MLRLRLRFKLVTHGTVLLHVPDIVTRSNKPSPQPFRPPTALPLFFFPPGHTDVPSHLLRAAGRHLHLRAVSHSNALITCNTKIRGLWREDKKSERLLAELLCVVKNAAGRSGKALPAPPKCLALSTRERRHCHSAVVLCAVQLEQHGR